MTTLIVQLRVVVDVDLAQIAEEDGLGPDDDAVSHYAGVLAGFVDNEINNCTEMPGDCVVRADAVYEVEN